MEAQFSSLSLTSEENEELLLDEGSAIIYDLCLVGRFLTDRNINFIAMKNRQAGLWRLGKGTRIKDLEPNLLLFQFYHEIDLRRVVEGGL